MILPDVNVLVRAFQREGNTGLATNEWLSSTLNSDEEVAIWDPILISTYRFVTHPKFNLSANTPVLAMKFLEEIRNAAVVIGTGDRYWTIVRELIQSTGATGNLVTDASIAAVAIENRCRIATFDSDFSRFPGLLWFEPPI